MPTQIIHTPLRYPGGKQKISDFIAEIIVQNKMQGCHYVEPYAGGAGVALAMLFRGLAAQIHLNDLCPPLYCFWKSVLAETDEFCRRIEDAELTVDEWRIHRETIKQPKQHPTMDVGFSFFYLNRCNRSGIANGGLIGGLRQDHPQWNMNARFNKAELIRRVESIGRKKRYIKLKNWQADRFMLQYVHKLPDNSLIYCDPPYYHKADRLYMNYYKPADHETVSRIVQHNLSHRWIVSYDNCPEIGALYHGQKSFAYTLQYNAASARKGSEVFFFSPRVKLPGESKVACIQAALASG